MDEYQVKVEALKIAHTYLEKMGWKYHPRHVGETANEILLGLKEGRPVPVEGEKSKK